MRARAGDLLEAAEADQVLTLKYMHLVNIGCKNFSIPLGTIVIKDYWFINRISTYNKEVLREREVNLSVSTTAYVRT